MQLEEQQLLNDSKDSGFLDAMKGSDFNLFLQQCPWEDFVPSDEKLVADYYFWKVRPIWQGSKTMQLIS
jgi:hypothetical protein